MCPKCRCWWNVAIFWSDESSWMSDFVGFWQCTVWLPLLGLVNPSHAQGPGHAGYPADPAAPQAPPTAFCWGQPFSLWTCAYFLNNFWGLHFYKSSCIGCVSVCARFCPLFRVFPPLLSLRPWSESHLSMKHPAKRRRSEGNDGKWLLSNLHLTFFPHIQGFKSNQGSHVILVALICSINIEPFRKNRESKKLNLALGLRVTSNSATLKFTREEPPSGLLTLRMPEPTVDPTNYWNQSRPMILRQNIPVFYQVRFAMDPTLSNISLRWILLCPTLVCDGTYPNPSQNDAKSNYGHGMC